MNEVNEAPLKPTTISPVLAERIQDELGQNVYLCYQCVKCSSGCPLSDYFDWQPNQIMRALQLGIEDIALQSKTPWLCASCQTCTTRCPQDLDIAASRILNDLTNLSNVYLEQVQTFGAVNRHPLGRVITIAYYSLLKISEYKVNPSAWANQAEWFSIDELPPLAFDHQDIFDSCKERLKQDIQRFPIAFSLLPQKFTLTELQELYESILYV